MTDKTDQLEVIQIKMDEARASLGLPLNALGDGTFIKLILTFLQTPDALPNLLNSIRAILDFFKTLTPQQQTQVASLKAELEAFQNAVAA